MTVIFALVMSAFALAQLYLLSRAVDALEARHAARLKALEQGRRGEVTGKTGQLPQQPVQQTPEPPTGTVAAKAVKPRVFLSQVPHTAVELDNGGLEWESKF